MPVPSPYGNPRHSEMIPLTVRGRQLYYPRNVNQRILPPNRFNVVLDEEAAFWREIIAQGGLVNVCLGTRGTIYSDPPWVKMPPQARRFSKINSIALPAPAQFGTDLLVTSFIVPLGYDGVITSTVNIFTGQNFNENGDITWRLQINQRYVKDMGNLQNSLGSMSTPYPVNNGSIRLQSRQLVQFFANVANGNPINGRIICAMFGWFYLR